VNATVQSVTLSGPDQASFDWNVGPNGVLEAVPELEMTLNVTNYPTSGTELYELTLLIVQSSTPHYVNAMTINGDPVSLFGYLNDTIPIPQARKLEIQTFKIFFGGVVFTKLESYNGLPPPALSLSGML
jgi:hypothetical protein